MSNPLEIEFRELCLTYVQGTKVRPSGIAARTPNCEDISLATDFVF